MVRCEIWSASAAGTPVGFGHDGPPRVRRQAVHNLSPIRRGEQSHADPVDKKHHGEGPVVEIDRQGDERDKGTRSGQHPHCREPLGAAPVGQHPRHRCRQQESDRHRNHVDRRPQRRACVVVPVLRQPDSLQSDDQDELQSTPADRGHQIGDVAEQKRPDAEQAQIEQRVVDPPIIIQSR